ncbi:alpha-L-rhamnosidase-like protein [Arcicella aurantiaca]|uniref:Alpha-L-rhamnosidase-like protein n=1 Tax=Arcicella aurantiaca TaxID=591202 RepID=A0A316EEG1_9BACT|nr:glycosyl hydrolase [Arcicella aurantiaca]PWK27763.1 alpha-L-rhamnosidase-like protein [Arcicella aurantiaca]
MKTLIKILFFLFLSNTIFAQISDKNFQNPPSEYGIRCWWWWLNGNVTKEAITRDLHEMKAKGFSGACIFDAGGQNQRGNGDVPEGPLWGSPAWRELYLHAINEADRLGLVMSLSIQSGWNLGGPDITPAEAAKQVVFSEVNVKGGTKIQQILPQPKGHEGFYQDIIVLAIPTKNFPNRQPIRDFQNKAATKEVGWSVPETRPLLTDILATEGEEDASVGQVSNLSQFVKDGVLNWDAPEGEWTIIRFGYAPTGAEVSTSSGKWQGHVIDYTSEKHFNRYWDTNVEPLLKMIGNKAGKTLKYLQTDSFEAGGMNWSDKFEDEFKKRRGYDPTPYLPVLAGKIIENREASNRFLTDLRKTLSDCIADNHYRVFAKRAKEYGMGIQPESAGPHAGPFDGLKNYGHSEIMMSEFWSPSPHRSKDIDRFFVKQAASAAKIFNKTLVGAESFTTIGPHWNDVIWADMKPSADHEFCAGLNLVYLHTFTCSPKEMGLPGQEYFAGTHFNPNVTWWNYSMPFVKYLSRIQYLMQNGVAQADVLYYYGDHIPNIGRYKDDDPAQALPNYDYDLINEDKLMDLSVKNGKIYLPHGVSYQVLALPNHQILSLKALRKVKELVENGATVVGEKPFSTASLVGGNEAEKELETITEQLWNSSKIRPISSKEALKNKGILPDCEFVYKSDSKKFDYIHRVADNTDYYFISNQNKEAISLTAAFRITGKQPEIWNTVTGEISPAKRFHQINGRTFVDLSFNPNGSVFVVFRKDIPNHTPEKSKNNPLVYKPLQEINNTWNVSFDTKWGGPKSAKFDKLISWTDRPEEGIKYYSGKAIYKTTFDVFNVGKVLNLADVKLSLGEVKDVGIAKVKLNGKDLGILWCPPYQVSVAGLLKEKGNKLEIEIVNTWRNRLIGDREKPQNERFTKTNITIKPDWKLEQSGLLGPVRLLD